MNLSFKKGLGANEDFNWWDGQQPPEDRKQNKKRDSRKNS